MPAKPQPISDAGAAVAAILRLVRCLDVGCRPGSAGGNSTPGGVVHESSVKPRASSWPGTCSRRAGLRTDHDRHGLQPDSQGAPRHVAWLERDSNYHYPDDEDADVGATMPNNTPTPARIMTLRKRLVGLVAVARIGPDRVGGPGL